MNIRVIVLEKTLLFYNPFPDRHYLYCSNKGRQKKKHNLLNLWYRLYTDFSTNSRSLDNLLITNEIRFITIYYIFISN